MIFVFFFFGESTTKKIILVSDHYLKANKLQTQTKPDCYTLINQVLRSFWSYLYTNAVISLSLCFLFLNKIL